MFYQLDLKTLLEVIRKNTEDIAEDVPYLIKELDSVLQKELSEEVMKSLKWIKAELMEFQEKANKAMEAVKDAQWLVDKE